MLRPLLLFFSTTLLLNSFAQKHQSSYLSFSAGAGFPIGDFASKDLANNASGFAKPGEYASFDWSKLVSQKIGFTFSLSGYRNAVNTKAMANAFSKHDFGTDIGFVTGPGDTLAHTPAFFQNWNFKKSTWFFASAQAGIYGEFPTNFKDLVITAKFTAGAAYSKIPELKGQAVTDTSFIAVFQSKGSAFGFNYLLGTGVKYTLKKNTFLLFNLNYQSTGKLRFKNIMAFATQQKMGASGLVISQSQSTADLQQSFQVLSASFGIGFQL